MSRSHRTTPVGVNLAAQRSDPRYAGPATVLHVAKRRFAAEILRLFLVGGAVVTALTLCVVVVAAPGPEPGIRLGLLVALLTAWTVASWRSERVAAAFIAAGVRVERGPLQRVGREDPEGVIGSGRRRRERWPWALQLAVLAAVALLMLVLAIDGEGRASPLSDQQYILIGIAAIVGGWEVLIATWFALNAGFIGLTAVGFGDRAVFSQPAFADLTSTTAAVVVVGVLFYVWDTMSGAIPTRLEQLRLGAPTLTLALSRAITDPVDRPGLPPARPRACLKDTELFVVDRLRAGDAPKQIARELGCSPHTVRKRIADAKKKTGAETLPELVVMTAPSSEDEPGATTPPSSDTEPRK